MPGLFGGDGTMPMSYPMEYPMPYEFGPWQMPMALSDTYGW
jgi:hypothetical protein